MESACTTLKKLKRHGSRSQPLKSYSARPWSPDFWTPGGQHLKKAQTFLEILPTDFKQTPLNFRALKTLKE